MVTVSGFAFVFTTTVFFFMIVAFVFVTTVLVFMIVVFFFVTTIVLVFMIFVFVTTVLYFVFMITMLVFMATMLVFAVLGTVTGVTDIVSIQAIGLIELIYSSTICTGYNQLRTAFVIIMSHFLYIYIKLIIFYIFGKNP